MKLKKPFAFIIFAFFLISTVYAQQGLLSVRIRDFSGGMNSNALADILAPNQGSSLQNVDLSRQGRLFKRKGQALFAEDVGSTAFTGLGRFDPDANTHYIVAASGVDILRSTISASSWTLVNPASGLTSGKNTEFVQADDLLFILNGFDSTTWWSGGVFSGEGAYPPSPPTAKTGAWLRNYLFLAGATTESDWVYISQNLEPTKFVADDIIKINTGDGQKIQRIVPYRLNELIIYKERSVFVLDITGSPPSTCTTDCWTVQPISTVVGTPAPRSVVSLGNDQWFLSSNPVAIRSLVRSNFDKILVDTVSDPVQDIFDGTGPIKINTTALDKPAAILFNNKYFLAIPTGTSNVNDIVLVYDFRTKSWSIIRGWYPAEWVESNNQLFYIDANDGRVVECLAGTTGDWAKGPTSIDSASSPTVGIEFVYISRAIDFDLPENFKALDSIEVEFDPTGNYNSDVYINLDNAGWKNIGNINLAGDNLTLPFTLPAVLKNSGVARKTFQLTQYGEFKKMEVMVRQAGIGESVSLQRITIFARPKPWRRE